MFESDDVPLDVPVLLGGPGGEIVTGVGLGGFDKGIALGHVAVGVLQVVAHFNIKIMMQMKDEARMSYDPWIGLSMLDEL